MSKVGRPKIDNPKGITVKGRIDVHKSEELAVYCKEHNTTVTEVIRRGIDLVLENNKEQPPAIQQ